MPCALDREAALCMVQPAFHADLMRVCTCLDEPLTQRVDVRELVCLAAGLDAAAERAQHVKGAAFTQQQRLARLEQLCRTLAPQQKPADTLAALGVFDFFPFLAGLMEGRQWGPGVQQAGAAYFGYVALLNQVVMMGTQLYNDAVVPQHHKYTAHQIALLYQSLNMLQGETKPIRRMVEARFDDIKTITEGPRPTLPPETSGWLQRVTWVCREEVAACPAYIHKRLAPLMALVKADGQEVHTQQHVAQQWQGPDQRRQRRSPNAHVRFE